MRMKVSLLFLAAALLLPAAEKVIFSEIIAPILYTNCVTCHRPGEAAPFSLISYDDAKKRGAQGHRIALHAPLACGPWLRRVRR